MSVHPFRNALLAAGLVVLVAPLPGSAQLREIVSKEVSVGRDEATLRLEFVDQGRLEISFDEGRVFIDGEPVGSFEVDGDLDAAWRELLGDAVRLDDGPLSRTLADWRAPAGLAGELADLAREVDEALETALADVQVSVDIQDGSTTVSLGDHRELVRTLFGSLERIGLLEDALDALEGDFSLYIDEDVTIEADETVEGSLVVIGADVRVEGVVEGDVVVVGGTLDLRDGSRVDGSVRLADTRLVRDDGRVRGDVVDLLEDERGVRDDFREELRREIEREVRNELRHERVDAPHDGGFSVFAPFRPVAQAVGGIVESLMTLLVLALVGAGVLAFFGENVDVIAETARRSPGRSAMVGVAGTFLLLPVWILGTIALAVSIIFIPVAVAWLPLFPIAAAFAALVGLLSVARNTGEWLADSEYPWTGWIRKSNSWMAMVGGLAGFMLAFIAADIVSIAPFLGFLEGLLLFAGCLVTFAALQVGFGAVLLTRAGRRREYWHDPDAAWEAAINVDVDDDGRAR